MAPYAFVNVTMASTLVLSATLAYASAPAFSVVHDVVREMPQNVQLWTKGAEEQPFDRPAPVVLDPTVLTDFADELNYMQSFPKRTDEVSAFNATSTAFVAAIPRAHIQGANGLVFDESGRVYHEKNAFYERTASPPMPVATKGGVRKYELLATTVQKYGHMYYHFLVETLQKFALLKPHLDAHPSMQVLSWNSPYEAVFLRAMGVDPSRVVTYEPYVDLPGEDEPAVVDYQADALLMPTPTLRITPSREGLMTTRAALGVKDVAPELRTKVIYVTRDGESTRRVRNEAEVVESLRAAIGRVNAVRGTRYELVVFHGMQPTAESLAETMDLFAHAAAVVGPHGAGLSHILFAPAGTAVVEFQFLRDPPMMFWHVAAALNQEYHLLPVPNTYWMAEEMDVPSADVADHVLLALGGGEFELRGDEGSATECPAGTHMPTVVRAGEAPAHWRAEVSTECLPCHSGRYATEGAAACRTCPINTYATEGQSECVRCGDGLVAWLPGTPAAERCLTAVDHLKMLSGVEENLIKLNKLSPAHGAKARRMLEEMEQGEGYFSVVRDGAEIAASDAVNTMSVPAPAGEPSSPTILDPRIVAIAVAEEERDILAAYGSEAVDLSHLARGDPGPGASALCRLQRISAAAGGWDPYGGAMFAERDYCSDPISAFSAEVYAFSGQTPGGGMGFVSRAECPSGFGEVDADARSGFSCIACDLVRLLPLAECGGEGADEARCCAGLAEWVWGGCLCDDDGVALAASLGATELLAMEAAEVCGFPIADVPRPSAHTCAQNATHHVHAEVFSSSAHVSAVATLVLGLALAL